MLCAMAAKGHTVVIALLGVSHGVDTLRRVFREYVTCTDTQEQYKVTELMIRNTVRVYMFLGKQRKILQLYNSD